MQWGKKEDTGTEEERDRKATLAQRIKNELMEEQSKYEDINWHTGPIAYAELIAIRKNMK